MFNCNETEEDVQTRTRQLAQRDRRVSSVEDGGVNVIEPWNDTPTGSVPKTPQLFESLKAQGLDGALMVVASAMGGWYCPQIAVTVYGVNPTTRRSHKVDGPFQNVDRLVATVLESVLDGR